MIERLTNTRIESSHKNNLLVTVNGFIHFRHYSVGSVSVTSTVRGTLDCSQEMALYGSPRETVVKQRVANSSSGGIKRLGDFFASHQSQRGAVT